MCCKISTSSCFSDTYFPRLLSGIFPPMHFLLLSSASQNWLLGEEINANVFYERIFFRHGLRLIYHYAPLSGILSILYSCLLMTVLYRLLRIILLCLSLLFLFFLLCYVHPSVYPSLYASLNYNQRFDPLA